MEKAFKILVICAAAAWLISSCESSDSAGYKEKMTLFCYAKADSTIDSLFLMRTGDVNESISLNSLGISGAAVVLFEKSAEDYAYSVVDTLHEYSERPGIYYLAENEFPGGFKTGYFYKIEAEHSDHGHVYAETVCPPELDDILVRNYKTGQEMVAMQVDPAASDTVYYRRGKGFDDVKLITCSFDSLSIILDGRIASYRLVPDDICRTDTSFWLEDTTETVWEDYPTETQIFKDREKYGSDFFEYYIRSISINWYALYHSGIHTLVLSSCDKVFRSYMETVYGGEERYSNVVNGLGLFSLSNSSSVRSRYRVYVKSLENKYP
ncbi:MAG TPA: DUF4249 family protein [Clostridiales bacterium]|nr:DUF4249 family protein [Clostridiales bacterium]HQP68907.1 DUF4249 family protein [Clostridiales bacterium]